MRRMFERNSQFQGDISNWDVSKVTNMNRMFRETSVFNTDIGGWQLNSLTSAQYMFDDAVSFNQDISGWTDHRNFNEVRGEYFLRNADNFQNEEWSPFWPDCEDDKCGP